MILDRAEVLRYLGYRGQAADEGVQGLIEEWGEKLLEVASPRFVDRRVPIGRMDGRLQLGTMSVESRSLQRHLEGCEEAILFAATLGAGVDRLIRQASASARAILQRASIQPPVFPPVMATFPSPISGNCLAFSMRIGGSGSVVPIR